MTLNYIDDKLQKEDKDWLAHSESFKNYLRKKRIEKEMEECDNYKHSCIASVIGIGFVLSSLVKLEILFILSFMIWIFAAIAGIYFHLQYLHLKDAKDELMENGKI